MEMNPIVTQQSFPRPPTSTSETHPSEESSSQSLESASYSYPGSMEICDRKGEVVRRRRRRQRRLVDESEIMVHRASPSTIPEHQSIHHAQMTSDKLSISAVNTSETVLMSTMTAETPEWVGRVPSAPTTGSIVSLSEATETFSQQDLCQSLHEGMEANAHPHQNSMRIPSPTRLSSKYSGPRRLKMSKSRDLTSKPKPLLRKHSTAPESCVEPKQLDVLDNVLMDRAFSIRQRLINFEMQELAVEAERAAESGLEKFVGSASKFGAEETPPYRPKLVDDAEFVMSSMNASEGYLTPLRPRNSFVGSLTQPMDYTPSYFSRKKIPVTKLRHVSEIIPNFEDMHSNIRIHLGREGVDAKFLPTIHTHRSIVKSDTDDTERADIDDAVSQVHSIAASHTGSISSFSSYAVASLTSLRDLMTSSSMTNWENSTATDGPIQTGSRKKKLHFSTDITCDKKNDVNTPPQAPNCFKSSVAESNSDSDDSSVEFYGRKSPVISSDTSERQRHILSSKSSSSMNTKQHVFHRLGSNVTGASVTFMNDQTQIGYQRNVPENPLLGTDQRNHTSSLSHLEILPSSSSIRANSKLTPMADFLTKIQNQFSLASSVDHQSSPKLIDEENEYFLTNFLYTCQDLDNAHENGGLLHLNLEINPERRSEIFCLKGCGSSEVLSACDSATRYADLVFDWFNFGRCNKSNKPNSIIDPDDQSMNPNWLKTWQTNDSEEKTARRRRIFTPPKLSAKNVVEHYEGSTFCPPPETVNLSECEDSFLGCGQGGQPLTCPEIQNNISGSYAFLTFFRTSFSANLGPNPEHPRNTNRTVDGCGTPTKVYKRPAAAAYQPSMDSTMLKQLLPRKIQATDTINPLTSYVSPSSISPSDQPIVLTPSSAGSERTLRQRSISAIASLQSSPSLTIQRRADDVSLSNTYDDETKGGDGNGRAGFRSALRASPFLLGPHAFSMSDMIPLTQKERCENGKQHRIDSSEPSPSKAPLTNLRDKLQSTPMTESPSGSTVGSYFSDVDLESGDRIDIAHIVTLPPMKKVQAYQTNYAFTLRSRENIIIHLLMEMKMLRTDLAFILFVTFYQFFHSSVTNLAYWQHAQLTAANRVPLKDLAFDLLPPLDGDLWIVSEYILYGILTLAIACILSNLVVKWNAPHGRPIYCVLILRRLGMTWIVCQSLRMISFLVTTLPGASRQCRYAVPDDMTAAEMLNMPAPTEGNPPGWAPPTDIYDLLFRVDASNGCGDLMFSSHTIYTMSFVCVIFKYFNFKWLKLIMAIGQLIIVPFILAARKHYSVDVFTALYVTPLVFEMLWTRFPDRDSSIDMAMHYGIRFYLAQVESDSFAYVVRVWGKEYQVDHDQLPFGLIHGHCDVRDPSIRREKGQEITRSFASVV